MATKRSNDSGSSSDDEWQSDWRQLVAIVTGNPGDVQRSWHEFLHIIDRLDHDFGQSIREYARSLMHPLSSSKLAYRRMHERRFVQVSFIYHFGWKGASELARINDSDLHLPDERPDLLKACEIIAAIERVDIGSSPSGKAVKRSYDIVLKCGPLVDIERDLAGEKPENWVVLIEEFRADAPRARGRACERRNR